MRPADIDLDDVLPAAGTPACVAEVPFLRLPTDHCNELNALDLPHRSGDMLSRLIILTVATGTLSTFVHRSLVPSPSHSLILVFLTRQPHRDGRSYRRESTSLFLDHGSSF